MKELGRCPICGSAEIQEQYIGVPVRTGWRDGTLWSVWECHSCTHRFCNPQPSFEELEKYYSASYDPYSPEHGPQGFDELLSVARRTGTLRHVSISKGMRVLDVGCGGGLFLRVAREMGASVQGVEPSLHGVTSCRAQGIAVFHGTVSEYLATNPGVFDLITCNHVVEHHPDPVRLMREFAHLRSHDGEIWMSVPNAGSVFARLLRDRWSSSDLPVHIHHFTIASLRRATERAGLDITSLRTESEGVAAAISDVLRFRVLIPRRLSFPIVRLLFPKSGLLARMIFRSQHGEAILTRCT